MPPCSASFCAAVDPVARVVMRGVRTRGSAGHGRREWYGATDHHADQHGNLVEGRSIDDVVAWVRANSEYTQVQSGSRDFGFRNCGFDGEQAKP